MASVNNIACKLITFFVLVTLCSGSAIPMWEYLSKGEKVSLSLIFD